MRRLTWFFILGTHADLLITVFHKIITTGHQRLQPLFDCLLTILVNGNAFQVPVGSEKEKYQEMLTACSNFSFSILEDAIDGR